MPQPTDLVTDLPADFEVFGQAVATSMADLLGGTTGQILAKNSNTDMDFVWIANDQGDITAVTAGTGISGGGTSGAVTVTNSMATTITTKGDLVPGTGSGTFARLAAGNNGEQIVADSSTSTGLRYQGSQAAGKNFLINGNMDFFQRGSFSSTSSAYSLDRWKTAVGGSASATTVTQQTTGVPAGSRYCMRVASGASGGYGTPIQAIETNNTVLLQGKTVVLSALLRRNATYNGTINVKISKNATVDADPFAAGWSIINSVSVSNASLPTGTGASDWYLVTLTAAIPNDGTANTLYVEFGGSVAATGAYWEMAQTQLEIGSVPTSFQRAGGTIQGELAACQRYLPAIQASASDIAVGQCYATTATLISIPFPVTARVAPTGVTVNSAGNFRLRGATSTTITCTSLLFSTASTHAASLDGNVASGLVAGNATNLYNAGSGTILFTGCEL